MHHLGAISCSQSAWEQSHDNVTIGRWSTAVSLLVQKWEAYWWLGHENFRRDSQEQDSPERLCQGWLECKVRLQPRGGTIYLYSIFISEQNWKKISEVCYTLYLLKVLTDYKFPCFVLSVGTKNCMSLAIFVLHLNTSSQYNFTINLTWQVLALF